MSFHLFIVKAEGPVIKETIRELTPKFTYDLGKIINSNVPVSYSSLNRNDKVIIVDEEDAYYYIDNGYLILAVDKGFIRRADEKPFEPYTGFTKNNSSIYSDYDLLNKVGSFKLNENVEVIDSFNGVLLVQDKEGNIGYMSPSSVSNKKITITYSKPSTTTSTPTNDGGGSSSSGGGSTPAPTPTPTPTPTSGDGEDITLAYYGDEYKTTYLEEANTIEGTVLADNTIAYIAFLKRNDDVKVLNIDEEICTILLNGYRAQLAKQYIRMPDEKYEEWDGYTKSGTKAYLDTSLKEVIKTYTLNNVVHIIDDFDGLYAILLEDGTEAYVAKKNISKNKITVYRSNSSSTSTPTNDGGGSSSSGGSSTPAPAPSEPEWTDPVM